MCLLLRRPVKLNQAYISSRVDDANAYDIRSVFTYPVGIINSHNRVGLQTNFFVTG